MTRTEAIAKINARLSSLADDEVLTVADMLDHIADAQTGIRRLTPRELQLIEQSKADFQDGRTSTLQESRAFVEAELARRRLAGLGVVQVSGDGGCTASDASRFFSFRRDGRTGRLAAAVALRR